MPRHKTGLNGWLANIQNEDSFEGGVPKEFTPAERRELREIFESAVFQKALFNARLSKPSIFPSNHPINPLDTALGHVIATNRLHELRGWRMFEVALSKQTLVPAPRRATPQDTFPDEGRIDHEAKKK